MKLTMFGWRRAAIMHSISKMNLKDARVSRELAANCKNRRDAIIQKLDNNINIRFFIEHPKTSGNFQMNLCIDNDEVMLLFLEIFGHNSLKEIIEKINHVNFSRLSEVMPVKSVESSDLVRLP